MSRFRKFLWIHQKFTKPCVETPRLPKDATKVTEHRVYTSSWLLPIGCAATAAVMVVGMALNFSPSRFRELHISPPTVVGCQWDILILYIPQPTDFNPYIYSQRTSHIIITLYIPIFVTWCTIDHNTMVCVSLHWPKFHSLQIRRTIAVAAQRLGKSLGIRIPT